MSAMPPAKALRSTIINNFGWDNDLATAKGQHVQTKGKNGIKFQGHKGKAVASQSCIVCKPCKNVLRML